jgi:hypothetical protein
MRTNLPPSTPPPPPPPAQPPPHRLYCPLCGGDLHVKYRLFLPDTGDRHPLPATADGLADLTALPPYLDPGQTAIIERHLPGRGWEPIAALTGPPPPAPASASAAHPPPRSL